MFACALCVSYFTLARRFMSYLYQPDDDVSLGSTMEIWTTRLQDQYRSPQMGGSQPAKASWLQSGETVDGHD